MKNLFKSTASLLGLSLLLVLGGCSKTTDDPLATLPAAEGTSDIQFLNYPSSTVTAKGGEFLSIAVQVTKGSGGNRPQKLRVYSTDVLNTRGSQEGSTVDLRNVDDPQIKNVNYTLPTATSGTKYLYFEVDESGGKFSRKLFTINSASVNSISQWISITLGAQENAAASRVSSSTGQTYKACDAAANIADIDITYAALGSVTAAPTLLSNPQRVSSGLSITASGCGDGASTNTGGGPATVFQNAPTSVGFDTADAAALSALTVSATTQSIAVNSGDVIAFRRTDGKKGLIKVNSVISGTSGIINISVKVQR